MVVEIIFFIVFMILYFYVYVELKVNKHNQIYYFDKEITREHIYKESLIKLPFFFNGKHINEDYGKSSMTQINKTKQYKMYEKSYDEISLLEPYTKFKAEQYIYTIKKNGYLPLLSLESSLNYLIVKKGKVKISFVHPKFKENVKNRDKLKDNQHMIDYIKEHNNIHTLECFENTVIYVPNHWILFIENIHDHASTLEIIYYKTITNQTLRFMKKQYNKMINIRDNV